MLNFGSWSPQRDNPLSKEGLETIHERTLLKSVDWT
jgi:hypothetical protein